VENGKQASAVVRPYRQQRPAPPGSLFSTFRFLFSVFCVSAGSALTGCGAPGQLVPPRPPVPEAIADVAARQAGESVILTFTLPETTVEGEPLEQLPQIEIYRELVPADAKVEEGRAPTRRVYTIPSALVETYLTRGSDASKPAGQSRVRFADRLKAEDWPSHLGDKYVYLVRTRASKRRVSPDSNLAVVRIYPVAARIGELTAALSEFSVDLRWQAPQRTTTGAPIAGLAAYRVYRAEVESGAESRAAGQGAIDASKAKLKAPLELVGVTPSTSYHDTQFVFDRTYLYAVRSVIQYEAD
jgi:hypothetical protein